MKYIKNLSVWIKFQKNIHILKYLFFFLDESGRLGQKKG